MPELNTTLTWALPFRVDKLGAHLEAYAETLSVIDTLRLCARHINKAEPKAPVQTLRPELVDLIGQFIVESKRETAIVEWAKELRCFQCDCDPNDHLTPENEAKVTPEQMHRIRQNVIDDVVLKIEMRHMHEWNGKKWRGRFVSANTGGRLLFSSGEQPALLLRAHFGVDFWLSHVRLSFDNQYLDDNTTIAYLTLPTAGVLHNHWDLDPYDVHDNVESEFGRPVQLGATPTRESLRRFPRALKRLGLEVFDHPSQRGAALASRCDDLEASDDAAAETSELAAEWPQLTLLLGSRFTT